MTLRGPDVASYEKGLNLATLPDADFYLVKSTEGAVYLDPLYPAWLIQMQSTGKSSIWYHFVTTADSAAAQAVNMLTHVGDAHLAGMLDIETEYGRTPTLTLLCNVIDEARARGLKITFVYLPQWVWRDLWHSPDLGPLRDRGVHLISSNYPGARGTGPAQYEADGGDDGPGWLPYGGMSPTMWQYTDAASEQGQLVDYNAFRGTFADLAAICGEDAPSVTPASTGWHRNLTLGAGGDDVRAVQVLLDAMGYDPQGYDGQYGLKTLAAVEHAQAAWGLVKDGVVGPKTWGAIAAHRGEMPYPGMPMWVGSHGVHVQRAQALLWLLGFDPAGIDGAYGAHTFAAAERFQGARGIKKDGIIGPDTWKHLTAAN